MAGQSALVKQAWRRVFLGSERQHSQNDANSAMCGELPLESGQSPAERTARKSFTANFASATRQVTACEFASVKRLMRMVAYEPRGSSNDKVSLRRPSYNSSRSD